MDTTAVDAEKKIRTRKAANLLYNPLFYPFTSGATSVRADGSKRDELCGHELRRRNIIHRKCSKVAMQCQPQLTRGEKKKMQTVTPDMQL